MSSPLSSSSLVFLLYDVPGLINASNSFVHLLLSVVALLPPLYPFCDLVDRFNTFLALLRLVLRARAKRFLCVLRFIDLLDFILLLYTNIFILQKLIIIVCKIILHKSRISVLYVLHFFDMLGNLTHLGQY